MDLGSWRDYLYRTKREHFIWWTFHVPYYYLQYRKFVRRSYRASEESKEGDYQTGREQKLALWVGSEIESIACLYWNVLQIKRNIDKNPTIQWSTFTEAEQETLRRVMNREDYQSQVSDHTFSKPKKTWRTCIDTICTTLQAGLRKFIHRLMIYFGRRGICTMGSRDVDAVIYRGIWISCDVFRNNFRDHLVFMQCPPSPSCVRYDFCLSTSDGG